MGYTIFDYLASEEQRYRMSIFISVGVTIAALIMTVIVLSTNSKSLNSYNKYKGTVVKVEFTTIKKPSRQTFEINQLRDYKVLMIETSNKKFYIGDDFEPYWKEVQNQIKSGGNITVYYSINPRNNNPVIAQLENDDQIIVPNSFKYLQGVDFIIYITVVLFFAIVMLIGLIRKRKLLKMKLW